MFNDGMKLINVPVKSDDLTTHILGFRTKLEEKDEDVLDEASDL